MNTRIMELDYALRQALQARDSDAVLRLTDSYLKLIQEVMASDGQDVREHLARQVSELLARNIDLACKIRDDLRSELRTVLKQRQIAGSGGDANRPGTPAKCSYCA